MLRTGEGFCDKCDRLGPFDWEWDEYGPIKVCRDCAKKE